MNSDKPPLDPHPLSEYVAWAGNRNRQPILEVFKEKLPKNPGRVLEFASGSGMHINYFANHFDHLHFHPSDRDIEVFDSIRDSKREQGNVNIADPVYLDLTDSESWFDIEMNGFFSAIYCINIFQVAPLSVADGMMECAAQLLDGNGILIIYGPFKIEGKFSSESNHAFHTTLSSAGIPEWGLKDVNDIKAAAANHGLKLQEIIDMPTNNFSLIFGKE